MISDCVSLSDKLGRPRGAFVTKNGAVNALLPTGVDELSPDEHGVTVSSPENDFCSGSGEQDALPAVPIAVGGIVPFVECKAAGIAIFRQIPMGLRRTQAHREPSS